MDELFKQSRNIFVGDSNEPKFYPKQIAFNVIPQAGEFLDDGSTTEEWKMVVETKKILDPSIKVTATCVRVPVFVGHSEAVNIEFENEISADEARAILREAPGVMVVDKREDGGYVTPVEAVGDYATYVSRIREDPTVENGLSLWVVSDNLRKGAALNAVQIAELLGRKHCKRRPDRTCELSGMSEAQVHYWTASDGVELAYHELGDGRPVVLLHGLFSDANMNWIKFGHAERIAARGLSGDHARPSRATGSAPSRTSRSIIRWASWRGTCASWSLISD